jgi:alpha-L-arabinofuranosidase
MAMRQLDERVQLVACGSSGAGMPTFGDWERTDLSRAYEDVDYLSCHAYCEEHDGDLANVIAPIRTEPGGRGAVFLVNRSATQAATVRVDARALPGREIREAAQLADADPYARNTFQDPLRVVPGIPVGETSDDVVPVTLPPVSWTALRPG